MATVKDIFGESDSEDEEEPVERKRLRQKKDGSSERKRGREDDENAYDSGEEVVETAEDQAFIDNADDDQELLAEYAKETQNFEDDPTSFEAPPTTTTTTPLDEAMARMKRKKSRELTIAEKDKIVISLLEQMNDAARKDARSREEGEPGLEKLALLPDVERLFAQRSLHQTLLDFDALMTASEWLEGSPTLALRTGLLKALLPLPAAPEHLKKSNIGRFVMRYSRDPMEPPQNRQLARQLVEQWARPVLGRGTNYKSLEAQQEQESGRSLQGTLAAVDKNRDDADDIIAGTNAASNRLRVPKFEGFDFVIRPRAATEPVKTKRANQPGGEYKPGTAKARLEQKVKKRTRLGRSR
ncbi:hypothetical protein CTAYLR_008456 [Chrysophaeum taylorii]|uniref:TFIIS N-terminal domain-containing protein n=1 Tax=Chrysophaeum taylorii TaxID=2483200 RepID=A0AAD7UB03_9STRA|nr:hypothetical protein CTAYLR_008456 [Chrysophaeum taylorii]